jgi:hypothetical protein
MEENDMSGRCNKHDKTVIKMTERIKNEGNI